MTNLLLLLCLLVSTSAAYLLSGIADTTQAFSISDSDDLIRHHLVCFRHDVYQTTIDPESCCTQLYLKGSIEKDQIKYCLDHVAVVSSMDSFGSVAPAFYLAIDSSATSDSHQTKQLLHDKSSYRQHRNLKVVEDGEKETLFDGYKGVETFSPFHLTGFMPSGLDDDENTERTSFPLLGIAKGSLSNEGGMHRSFGQTVHLSFSGLPLNNKDRYRVNLNATVLLPITESVFIDADDPLIVEYQKDAPDGVKCRAKFVSKGASTLDIPTLENECSIQFKSSEVIDIEQPSFASRQYVVVYHISASLDFDHSNHEGTEGLDLQIDYATTLHIRYPSPMLNHTGVTESGLVPIVIQQPVLYSAIAHVQCLTLDCSSERKYFLKTDASTSQFSADMKWDVPQPIVVNVAAGVNSDYWWVTVITMLAAVIGGIAVIKSMDSISKWA